MKLTGGLPRGALATGGSAAFAQLAHLVGSTSSPNTTRTWAGQAWGPAHPSRRLITIAYVINSNIVSDTNGMTALKFGGSGGIASARIRQQPATAHVNGFEIWATARQDAGGPSADTGEVYAQRAVGNGFSFVALATFACYGLNAITELDVINLAGGNPTASGNIDLTAGGIMLAMGVTITSGHSDHIWAGAPEAQELITGVSNSGRVSAAFLSGTAAEAARALSVTSNKFTYMQALTMR